MHRVVVLGRGGAGKSVLARDMGRATALPVVELDREFWSPQLEPMALDAWRAHQRARAENPAGSWTATSVLTMTRSPDCAAPTRWSSSTCRCAVRVALRRGQGRLDFWLWVLPWRRRSRPKLMAAIATHAPTADVVVLRHRKALDRWRSASVAIVDAAP